MRISDWSSDVCSSDLSPARIVPGDDGYELLPTTIDLGRRSSVRLAGKFGEGIMVQSRFERVNMALLNAIYPDMGLGGRATGSLDFEQAGAAAFPRADARLTISNFTRTTAALVSEPVDRSEEHTSELQSLMRISY